MSVSQPRLWRHGAGTLLLMLLSSSCLTRLSLGDESTIDPHTNYELIGDRAHSSQLTADMLKRENAILRKRLHELRTSYGRMYCKLGAMLGPTGGFCMSDGGDSKGVGGNDWLDVSMCRHMAQLYSNQAVLDLGCGVGHYGKCILEQNKNVTWTGFDGSENIEIATKGQVVWMDLATPQWIGHTFDWVMAIEVGEHIPEKYEAAFLDNICRHASKGIIVSWAVPGQGGHGHVNNRENSYIIDQMKQRGFDYDTTATQELRASILKLTYLQNTIMLFKKAAGGSG